MKLSVKLDSGSGRKFNVGTFSEIGRDTAFEFSGEFLSSGLNPAPFRLSPGTCLNVIAHNRDDHLKNFSFLMDHEGKWELAPFYDFTHTQGSNGWQTLSVAGEGANPGVKDLRRLAVDVGLDARESEPVIERVDEACRSLRDIFLLSHM